MSSTRILPPIVRCNHGFGQAFWLVTGVTLVIFLVAVAAARGQEEPGGRYGLIVGVLACGLPFLTRASLLPRLEFDLIHGHIRTRHKSVPYSAIGIVRFSRHERAGIWADIVSEDGLRLWRPLGWCSS